MATPFSREMEVIPSDYYVVQSFHKHRIMHGHNSMEFAYIERGTAFHRIEVDGKVKDSDYVKSGNFMLLDMHCRHSFEECSADFSIINMLFFPNYVKECYRNETSPDKILKGLPFGLDETMLISTPVNKVLFDSAGLILPLFQKALDVYNQKLYGHKELIHCYIIEIILRASQPFLICNIKPTLKCLEKARSLPGKRAFGILPSLTPGSAPPLLRWGCSGGYHIFKVIVIHTLSYC